MPVFVRDSRMQGSEELTELDMAVWMFSGAMRSKLIQKARQGYSGALDPAFKEILWEKLCAHVARGPDAEQERDIANLAMMLWQQRINKLTVGMAG